MITAPTQRMCGLDALRGIAVFLMIEQHMGVWLWEGMPKRGIVGAAAPLVAFNALGGGAAPMFITLAGVGTALLVRARPHGVDGVLVRRGLVLIAFGYLLSAMTPSWFSWGSFFVLHLMGVAMVTATAWRRLSDRGLIVMAMLVAILAICAQWWLNTPLQLDNLRMRDVSRPGGALRLAFVESQFPILPWLAPFMLGMVAGRAIAGRRFAFIVKLGAVALTLGAGGAMLARFVDPIGTHPFWRRAFGVHLGFFPASISILGFLVGLVLLVIVLVAWLDDQRPLSERNPLVTLGRASLTLLLVHVPLFRQATRPLGMWQSLGAGATLVTIFAFLAVALALTSLWRRVGYRGGAEWLLRKLGG